MKRLFLPILCLSFFNFGCIDVGMKMKIGADWSGDMSLKLEMLDQMFQMLTSAQGGQMGLDFSLIDEEKVRALVAENGGRVRKFDSTVENGIRTIDMVASAPNLRKFVMDAGGGQLSLKQEGDVWVWNLLDNEAMSTFTQMEDELLEQQLNMLLPSLTGLKLSLDISVPQLIETNLKKVNGTTARFDLDFDRDIAGKQGREAVTAFKKLLEPKYVKFKGVK